jgi:Raf kinase inhibitor-like YbhB/YbcL family protein
MPIISKIEENSVPGKQGVNNASGRNYHGPCPPSGTHRYFFKIYALDTVLNLEEGISKGRLEKAMQGHILDSAELIGLYKRKR